MAEDAFGPTDDPPTALERELREAREQSAASREILEALGRNDSDPGAVLDTIVASAARLCGAAAAQLFVAEGDVFQVSRVSGTTPAEYRQYLLDHPITRSRSSTVGRAAADRRTHQVADVLDDADYGRHDLQRRAGFRTLLSTPLLLGDEVVAVLSLWRTDVAPFGPPECERLEGFAVQGAIVLRQVRLTRELEARGRELGTKLAQLEALREVEEAVNSSLDLDEVLERIVSNAVRLTNRGFGDITLRTDGGSILEYSAESDTFTVRGVFGATPRLLEQLSNITIRRELTLVGRAADTLAPVEVPDLGAAELDPYLDILFRDGWRSVLAVPMEQGGSLIGVLVIRRRGTGHFPPDVIALLETFAGQSALAIVNARLYRELETKSAELEIASNHKSDFLASMSHELRTPLNAVIGFSEVLLERLFGELNDSQDGYLRDIRRSGAHLLDLVNDILDLSRIERGRMDFEPTSFIVSGSVDDAVTMVRERAAAHCIGLSVQIANDVDMIEADRLHFTRVLVNLVTNAVKFTPDGGKVTVRVHRDGGELHVAVIDTGIGIAPEDQERIFESFQQGRRGLTKGEGTGLGLALSRQIVERMGGRMWLQSVVGVGSTFAFAVPVDPARVGESPRAAAGDGPILVLVDDDKASLDLIEAYLTGSPVRTLHAHDGIRAIEVIRRTQPACVVLDLKLPRRDGWEVLSELKADPATSDIPIVVATVLDDRPRATALGAYAYLRKPVSRDGLLATLSSLGIVAGQHRKDLP